MNRLAVIAVVALVGTTACGNHQVEHSSSDPRSALTTKQLIERTMLKEAKSGDFQPPPKGYQYGQPVECRVDRRKAFHGADIYLCKIAIKKMPDAFLWEWGAWYQGSFHTHRTDPKLIPTITGAFDPPW